MINLLPADRHQSLNRNYRARRWAVWLIGIAVVIISLIGGLFLLKAMLVYKTTVLEQALSSGKYDASNKGFDLLDKTVKNTNKEIDTFLSAPAKSDYVSSVLKSIATKRCSGIKVLGLSYEQKPDGATVSIRGKSNSRESLIAFTDALRTDPLFKSVDSPISNIIRQSNSDFNLSVKLQPPLQVPRFNHDT